MAVLTFDLEGATLFADRGVFLAFACHSCPFAVQTSPFLSTSTSSRQLRSPSFRLSQPLLHVQERVQQGEGEEGRKGEGRKEDSPLPPRRPSPSCPSSSSIPAESTSSTTPASSGRARPSTSPSRRLAPARRHRSPLLRRHHPPDSQGSSPVGFQKA
jgi:hypothetical protein